MADDSKERKKYRVSTQDRRLPFYPTPQNEPKIKQYCEGRQSINSFVNEAVAFYLANKVNVTVNK